MAAIVHNGVCELIRSLQVRSKAKPEEVDSWIETEKAEDALGGAEGVLRALVRTLLIAGAKSYTHMVIAMERYYGPVAMRTSSLGSQVGSHQLNSDSTLPSACVTV